MSEARDHEETAKEGRDRVRGLLLARLDEAGLVRPKGVTAAAHDELLARLVDHLAYMSGANLQTLADVVMEAAQGPSRNVWPAEATVRNFAHALQAPPLRQRRIITSWLASREGPKADAEGCLVELFQFLRANPIERPPLAMDQRLIREAAGQNARLRGMIRERIERGAASDEDRAWLARYVADEQTARAIVADGEAKRLAATKETVSQS